MDIGKLLNYINIILCDCFSLTIFFFLFFHPTNSGISCIFPSFNSNGAITEGFKEPIELDTKKKE